MGGGGGFCKTKKLKEMYKAKLEFPEGWRRDLRNNPFLGGGMDIFWNYKFREGAAQNHSNLIIFLQQQ